MKRSIRPSRPARAFSLVEMLVVLVLAAILASLALPAYEGYLRRARRTEARSALLQARLLSGRGDPDAVHAELNRLIEEVTDGYRSFQASVATAPRHSRIDDVENTFQRLLQSLKATIAD